ncbi:MAG TPA: hypothetical protein VLE91_00160 [Candidatus Saccharimonadales bacterium]|nr:hypothetical protein [Candidatus Saccharimonadales bacterium]
MTSDNKTEAVVGEVLGHEPDDKLLTIGEPFRFSKSEINSSARIHTMHAQVKDVGPIVGIASQQRAATVHEPDNYMVFFEIDAPATPKEAKDATVFREPSEQLLMWAMTLDDKVWITQGRIEENPDSSATRATRFDSWFDVTGRKGDQIKLRMRERVAEPLTLSSADLKDTRFMIGLGSSIK